MRENSFCGAKQDHGPHINPYPPIDLGRVMFTTYALEEFKHLYTGGFTPFELLSWSEENSEASHEWIVKRLTRHSDEARYFTFGPWRFIVIEKYGGNILLVITFEKNHTPPNPRKKISKRERRRQKQRHRTEAMAW